MRTRVLRGVTLHTHMHGWGGWWEPGASPRHPVQAPAWDRDPSAVTGWAGTVGEASAGTLGKPFCAALGCGQGHRHGAVSTVLAASSMAAFNLPSFLPQAADTPADDGFRAPDASLQAAATQLQGQCAASPQLCCRAGAPLASLSTQILLLGCLGVPARLRAAELPPRSPHQPLQHPRLVLSPWQGLEGEGSAVGDAQGFAGVPQPWCRRSGWERTNPAPPATSADSAVLLPADPRNVAELAVLSPWCLPGMRWVLVSLHPTSSSEAARLFEPRCERGCPSASSTGHGAGAGGDSLASRSEGSVLMGMETLVRAHRLVKSHRSAGFGVWDAAGVGLR